tara:strand:- start:456 stop:1301 length:846 start_codon:yes stop_codon:yes gene_type:complete
MAKTGRNKPRTSGKRKGQASTLEKAAAGIMLFAIPGVGTVRAAVTAGKVAPRIMQMVRQLGGKKIAKPTTTQIKNAKPTSALKQKAGEIKVGSRTATKAKPKTGVKAERKPLKGETKVASKKPAAKKDSGMVITRTKIKQKPPAKSSKITTGDKLLAGATALAAGTAALTPKGQRKAKAEAFTSKAKEGGPGRQFKKKVTGPKSRPTTDPRKDFAFKATPGKKKVAPTPKRKPKDKNDPRGNQIKAMSSLPAGAKRKFQGSYNSKTEKLRNIGGKTYVFKK